MLREAPPHPPPSAAEEKLTRACAPPPSLLRRDDEAVLQAGAVPLPGAAAVPRDAADLLRGDVRVRGWGAARRVRARALLGGRRGAVRRGRGVRGQLLRGVRRGVVRHVRVAGVRVARGRAGEEAGRGGEEGFTCANG